MLPKDQFLLLLLRNKLSILRKRYALFSFLFVSFFSFPLFESLKEKCNKRKISILSSRKFLRIYFFQLPPTKPTVYENGVRVLLPKTTNKSTGKKRTLEEIRHSFNNIRQDPETAKLMGKKGNQSEDQEDIDINHEDSQYLSEEEVEEGVFVVKGKKVRLTKI